MHLRNHFDDNGNSVQGLIQENGILVLLCYKTKKTPKMTDALMIANMMVAVASFGEIKCDMEFQECLLSNLICVLCEAVSLTMYNGEMQWPRVNPNLIDCDMRFNLKIDYKKLNTGVGISECMIWK